MLYNHKYFFLLKKENTFRKSGMNAIQKRMSAFHKKMSADIQKNNLKKLTKLELYNSYQRRIESRSCLAK